MYQKFQDFQPLEKFHVSNDDFVSRRYSQKFLFSLQNSSSGSIELCRGPFPCSFFSPLSIYLVFGPCSRTRSRTLFFLVTLGCNEVVSFCCLVGRTCWTGWWARCCASRPACWPSTSTTSTATGRATSTPAVPWARCSSSTRSFTSSTSSSPCAASATSERKKKQKTRTREWNGPPHCPTGPQSGPSQSFFLCVCVCSRMQ